MATVQARPVLDPVAADRTRSTHADWPREDLVRRLCLALGIAKRAIAFLAEDGYRDEGEPEASFGPDKPFAETAMLLYVASGVTGESRVTAGIAELAALLLPHARSHRTACAVAMHPTISLQLAMPHVLLGRLGWREPRFDRVLALSVGSAAHLGNEVVPHRALERMWITSVWRGDPPGPEFDEVALKSVLNHPLDLLLGTRDNAYAHTHAFMYFTDFGYATRALPRPRAEILAESSAVMARSLLLEDFDLTGEVLMAWPFVSAPWNPAAAFGFRVLAELEDAVGFLPARQGTPAKFDQLSGATRTRYALAASYHTAFVMGMLSALALRPGNAPPVEIGGSLVPAATVDELLTMVPDVATPWRQTFDRLQPAEQRALGPFLLDMALLSRVRSNDFVAVARLLDLAVRHGLADSPVCAQSVDLLRRISACVEQEQ